jgi:hypothetical protein
LRQPERILPNVALEMEDALSGNIAEFGSLDFVEGFFARMKARERVVAGRIAQIDESTLVPVPAIDFNRIIHNDLEFTASRRLDRQDGTLGLTPPVAERVSMPPSQRAADFSTGPGLGDHRRSPPRMPIAKAREVVVDFQPWQLGAYALVESRMDTGGLVQAAWTASLDRP